MNCEQAQQQILDQQIPASHLADCPACTEFAAVQQQLDQALSSAIATPKLSPHFRASLARQISRQQPVNWPEFLPDLAHFAGCLAATAICLIKLPFPPLQIATAGLAVTLVTHFAQAHLLSSMQGWKE